MVLFAPYSVLLLQVVSRQYLGDNGGVRPWDILLVRACLGCSQAVCTQFHEPEEKGGDGGDSHINALVFLYGGSFVPLPILQPGLMRTLPPRLC